MSRLLHGINLFLLPVSRFRKRREPFGVATTVALLATAACAHDSRSVRSGYSQPSGTPTSIGTRTWPICTLVGPKSTPGVFGTDLGFTVKEPGATGRLAVFFGDTFAKSGDTCSYPMLGSDDLEASLPEARPAVLEPGPPGTSAGAACDSLSVARTDPNDATSWRRTRLFSSLEAQMTDTPLDTGVLRTPVAAFSTGETLFTLYFRGETDTCKDSNDCSEGMMCSGDPAYRGRPVGVCERQRTSGQDAAPSYCRDVNDCGPGLLCERASRGVCLATPATGAGTVFTPSWYRDDPRTLVARTIYVAARAWPDRPGDYGVVHRFSTSRFVNATARTIAYFDPDHPERNDYRPGSHTLLLFGRAAFFTTQGVQALPFLLYQPLQNLRGDLHHVEWKPRFFAGYDASGRPRWSPTESDAVPIYGTETRERDGRTEWAAPEFDYVNQMSVSYVEPLGRWLMLYGGDVPAFMIRDPHDGGTPAPVHRQPSPGAIHLRTALHPWGRLMNEPLRYTGWSAPEPVLTRQEAAPYLACPDEGKGALAGCLPESETTVKTPKLSPKCVIGAMVLNAQNELSGNQIGRLYGANVIDEWTRDVTAEATGLGQDERAVDVYWNASTWNPYAVVLVQTELRGRRADELKMSAPVTIPTSAHLPDSASSGR